MSEEKKPRFFIPRRSVENKIDKPLKAPEEEILIEKKEEENNLKEEEKEVIPKTSLPEEKIDTLEVLPNVTETNTPKEKNHKEAKPKKEKKNVKKEQKIIDESLNVSLNERIKRINEENKEVKEVSEFINVNPKFNMARIILFALAIIAIIILVKMYL